MIKKIINFIIKILNNENEVFYVGSLDKLPEPLTKTNLILIEKIQIE